MVDSDRLFLSAIFYINEQQKQIAERTIEEMVEKGTYRKPIVTESGKSHILQG